LYRPVEVAALMSIYVLGLTTWLVLM